MKVSQDQDGSFRSVRITAENSASKTLLVVDLDFTLVNTNTTFHYLEFVTPRKYRIFSKILLPTIHLNRLFNRDVYKALLVLVCIRSQTREFLQQRSREYYKYISEKRHTYLNRKLLEYIRNLHVRTVLVTASLDIVAEQFRDLGFDEIIGSKSFYKDGKFRCFIDLYGRKHRILQALSERYDKVIVIEDLPEREYLTISNVYMMAVPR